MRKRPYIFYGWIILATAFFTIVLGYALRNTFSVFYPTIVEEFGWGRGSTALMFSLTIIAYGLVAPMAGGLIDRFGPKLTIAIGACIMGSGLALCSLATTQWQFYLFFGVMVAIGLSMVGWTPLTVIVSNWFSKERGLVFGILGAGFSTSLVLAPVAQFLILSYGWQIAYIIIGLFAIVVIVLLSVLVMRNPRETELLKVRAGQRSVVSATPESSGGVTSLEAKWTSTVWTLPKAIKTRHYWLLFMISIMSIGFAETTLITHQVYFFKDVGYEPMAASLIYSIFGMARVAGNLCSSISDRIGREKVFVPGCLLSAVAVGLLFLVKDTSQPLVIYLFAICFGVGSGIVGPLLYTIVADLFEGKYFGAIQGTIVFGYSLGGAVSPWLAGFMHDKTGSYFVTFTIVLGSLVASAALMWLAAPRKVRPISVRTQH